MSSPTKNPPTANQAGFQNQQRETKHSPGPRKWQRVLCALLSGRSYNQSDATRDLRDWCLHTTVAGLEARGVRIDRHDEVVPGQYGNVHCKRYQLAPESRARAMELLGLGEGDPHAQ